jgi:hypothetical protein
VLRLNVMMQDGSHPALNPLDKKLEDVVTDAIVSDLIDGNLVVLDRRDLAKRAALDGFRQGIALAAQVVGEMAADENSDLLREVERQITTLPDDLP